MSGRVANVSVMGRRLILVMACLAMFLASFLLPPHTSNIAVAADADSMVTGTAGGSAITTSNTATTSKRVLRVGFFHFDGYHMQAEDGYRSGYGYDFLQEMARYADWTYEYVGYDDSWADMLSLLADGKIDILTSAQKTPEREETFAFSEEPIGTSSIILTVKSGDTRWTSGDYKTYDGMRVGLIEGSSRNQKFADFAAEKGFTYTPVYYGTVEQMTADLQAGTVVDALVTSNLRSVEDEWVLDEFDPSDFYVIVRKDDTELIDQVDDAIEQMDANIPDWRSDLWARYYTADSGSQIAFTQAERSYIEELQRDGTVIEAIVEPDRAPYSSFEDGSAKGIIPKLFDTISQETGLTFSIVKTTDRQSYFDAVDEDDGVTVRIDALSDFYEAEKTGFKLTSPYLTATVSAVTRKGSSDSPRSIALPELSDFGDYHIATLQDGATIQHYPTVEDCLKAVRDGNADITYVLTYTAQRYLDENDPSGRLKATLMPQLGVSYAIGVRDSADIRLVGILDKAVRNLKSADVATIVTDEVQGKYRTLTVQEFFSQNPWVPTSLIVGLALVFTLALLLIYRQKNLRLMKQKNGELAAEAQRADRASTAKSEFLSRMSHDIRTPMNGIIGMTRIAREQDNPVRTDDCLDKIDTSSKFLLSLINDVLDMAKAEEGRIELHPEPYPIKEFVRYTDAVIRTLVEERRQTLLLSRPSAMDDVVPLLDKLRFNQIVFNLLSNAVKYTPEGGTIRCVVDETRISDGRMSLHIDVIDNGIGMSEEFQKVLFEPFTQENRDDISETRRSGLGLAITRRLVDAMGGSISVESESGKGTTFHLGFDVDCISAAEMAQLEQESLTRASNMLDLVGKHILLCEDHPLNQEIAKTILAEKGALVEVADDGQKGIDAFTCSPVGYFDAILMDIRMPIIDGYETTRSIRKLERPDARTVPIIAMTADAFADAVKRCQDAGMNGHIAKPIDPQKLFDALAECMEGNSASAVDGAAEQPTA